MQDGHDVLWWVWLTGDAVFRSAIDSSSDNIFIVCDRSWLLEPVFRIWIRIRLDPFYFVHPNPGQKISKKNVKFPQKSTKITRISYFVSSSNSKLFINEHKYLLHKYQENYFLKKYIFDRKVCIVSILGRIRIRNTAWSSCNFRLVNNLTRLKPSSFANF